MNIDANIFIMQHHSKEKATSGPLIRDGTFEFQQELWLLSLLIEKIVRKEIKEDFKERDQEDASYSWV